jgi:nucleolar complex protein 2
VSGDGPPKADSEAQLPEELNVAEMDVDEFLAGHFLNEGSDGEEDTDGDDDEAAPSNSDELLSSENEDGADVSSDEAGAAAGRLQHSSQEPNPPSQDNDEGDDDMSDDETGTGVGKQNRRLKDEIAAHRAQLEALKQADPEFYEYLQSTDKELLAFGQGEPGSEDEEEEEEELESSAEEQEEEEDAGDRETEAPAAEPVPSEKSMTVTLSMVNSWCSAAKSTASPGSLRQLFRAYRAACHYGDTEDSVDEGLRLGSSAVYSRLMMFVLREADGLLRRALGADDGLTASAVMKMPRWRKIEALAKSYLGNTLHLLGESNGE